MAVEGSASTQAGQVAPRTTASGRRMRAPRLQAEAQALPQGRDQARGHPALKAVLTYPSQGDFANIARAQVALPHSEFFDQRNIAKACGKVLLAQRACPATSIMGKAKAWTPLLDHPLEGPVYLVGGSGYRLPAMVTELNGQIRVLLVGKVDTGKAGGIRNTFEAVPDAPVSRFVLELRGGKKHGLIENSEDLCRKTAPRLGPLRRQNGKVAQLHPAVPHRLRQEGRRRQEARRPPARGAGLSSPSAGARNTCSYLSNSLFLKLCYSQPASTGGWAGECEKEHVPWPSPEPSAPGGSEPRSHLPGPATAALRRTRSGGDERMASLSRYRALAGTMGCALLALLRPGAPRRQRRRSAGAPGAEETLPGSRNPVHGATDQLTHRVLRGGALGISGSSPRLQPR